MDKPEAELKTLTMRVSIPANEVSSFTAMMQHWMLMVPTIYFLDICSIGHVKTYLSTKNYKDENHERSIQSLRQLDRPYNRMSYLAALMEKASDQRSTFSLSEFIAEARRDWDAIEAFFDKASVCEPWGFVEEYITELFGAHPEQSMPEYIAFLEFANAQGLHNKLAERKKLETVRLLCTEADRLGISKSHPVVLVTVACIYGCEDARLVMKFAGKPENFNPGNALGDIQSITRVAGILTNAIQHAGANGSPFKNGKFMTADSPLYNLLGYFTVQSVSATEMQDGLAHQITVSVDAPNLYPDLFGLDRNFKDEKSRKELDKLYELLGAKY